MTLCVPRCTYFPLLPLLIEPIRDKVIFSSNSYETAQLWLLEDEYEPVEGRLLAGELVNF